MPIVVIFKKPFLSITCIFSIILDFIEIHLFTATDTGYTDYVIKPIGGMTVIVKLTVENALQAKKEIEKLESQGYHEDHIYLFAHDPKRQHDIADALDTEDPDAGFINKLKNFTSSRGDQLRSEMQSVGLTEQEADQYEEVLDTGKLVIVAKKE